MNKSKILLTTLLSDAVIISGCSSKEETKSTTESSSSSSSSSNKTETSKDKVYGLNEDWVVDGQWKLKTDSVTTTTERNQFSEDNPAQVVVITYTYENLGYTGEIQDLFFTPKQVVDEGKKVAKYILLELKIYSICTRGY
ncbi:MULTISPECIES: hypothetical protein [unclassified Gemella]|uniref:hypothetical protein n=1 Tax=unclassified Gemella TaxID=2624949 RepID=UPI001D168BB6|nr:MULTISPECIES: hypothetical protein [unclassified Gemella]